MHQSFIIKSLNRNISKRVFEKIKVSFKSECFTSCGYALFSQSVFRMKHLPINLMNYKEHTEIRDVTLVNNYLKVIAHKLQRRLSSIYYY